MHVYGSHRPRTTHSEATSDPVRIEAEGPDWETARAALRAQVPEGHQLLHITVG